MGADEYIRYAYLRHLLSAEFDGVVGNSWVAAEEMQRIFTEAIQATFRPWGLDIGERYQDIVHRTIELFKKNNALLEEGDEYTGIFWFVPVGAKDQYIRALLSSNAIHARLERLGPPAFETALRKISSEEGWSEFDPEVEGLVSSGATKTSMAVPAADRLVTLTHNQQSILDDASTAVIDTLQQENSVDGDADLRVQLLGELRAGRELIRSQSLRALLLYETVVSALGRLIDKFGGTLLAEAAKKFVDLLIEHVFR